MTFGLNKRLVGAVGAIALTGGTVAVTTPAEAATGTLAYTCTVPLQGLKQFTAVADTDAPQRIAYGETIAPAVTGTITFPEDVTRTLRDDVGAKKVDGKAEVAATVDGVARPWTLVVPQTNVPPNGSLVLTGTGPAGTFAGDKVGTVYDVAVGDFTATINNYQANGAPTTILPTAVVPCTLNAGQDPAVDTIKVVKDRTTTAVTPKQFRQGAKARAKVKVVAEHGKTVKGKIKAKLLRNGKVLQAKVLSLRDGQRRVTFLRLRNGGTYTVKAKYLGNQNFKGSSAMVKVNAG